MKIKSRFASHRIIILLLAILVIAGTHSTLGAQSTYKFSYTFSGEMEVGPSLLSFWFFLEASATAHFTAETQEDGSYDFNLASIDETGYIARTRGILKKSLKLFTANSNLEKNHTFAQQKWLQLQENPVFSDKVKKYREFPFLLPDDYQGAIRFSRDATGIFRDLENNLQLTYVDYEKDSYPYNNAYAIMLEIMQMYPPLPPVMTSERKRSINKSNMGSMFSTANHWQSSTIFIDTYFNKITLLCSRSAKRNIHFNQEKGFPMAGHVAFISDDTVQITSYASPQIEILKKVYIREFKRVATFRLSSGTLLEDRLWVRLENEEGKGLKLESALVLAEPETPAGD